MKETDFQNKLKEMDDDEKKAVDTAIEAADSDYIESSLEVLTVYRNCWSMEDVAHEFIKSFDLLRDIPELLQEFFDYKKFGEWMESNGWFVYAGDGLYVEIPDDNYFRACMSQLFQELFRNN